MQAELFEDNSRDKRGACKIVPRLRFLKLRIWVSNRARAQ